LLASLGVDVIEYRYCKRRDQARAATASRRVNAKYQKAFLYAIVG